ncbi:MAG TPA: LssY C-terminal domain-containing protein, partial [Bryobacteraceae bacterium]
ESKIASVAAIDPIAYLFSTVSSTAALGFAEPEILYDAGTELEIEVTAPLITSKTFQPSVPAIATSPGDLKKLEDMIRALPFRTATQGKNKPSDITNLAFIGSTDAVKRAFQAAEWVYTDQLTANSTFRTFKTISGNEAYKEAPMSVLLLDERPPIFTLTKTTNTFNSRHHLRVFDPALEYEGKKVLTSSSTQDIGIAFSAKQKTFIHVIDQYIDNERSKVVDDLVFTGCVAAVQLVPRPWVPKDAYNSTGDRLRTDGAIAVMQMNDCQDPKRTPDDNAVPPSRLERITRDTILTLRNDLWRGNLGYQGYSGAKWLRNYWRTKNELKPERGTWRKANIAGIDYTGLGDISTEEQPSARIGSGNGEGTTPGPAEEAAERSHRWDPPSYEIGVQGGYLRYPTLRTEGIGITASPIDPSSGDPTFLIGLLDEVDGGWSAGIVFTANTWRWISNEFSYNYQRGKYRVGVFVLNTGDIDPIQEVQSVGLATRQFEYNVLFNARPRESRWRPYVAIGPAVQLISLTDAPIKKASGPFKLGLQNIGILKAAFDFGSTPPLEGGGIYQIGLQYGCGIKFRVLPRLTVRADFRETWSKNPQFILDSYTKDFFFTEDYKAEYEFIRADSKFRQQRFTLGFSFTF